MENFNRFYQTHKDKLFGYLLRLGADYHLAADLMQESFTRCLERYGPGTDSMGLLFTIARNAFLDAVRRRNPQYEVAQDQAGDSPSPEATFMVREEYRRVMTAMERLGADERDILALTLSGEFNYRQIAAMVGLSVANVKVKVHRSRLKLKKFIQEDTS